MESLRAAAIGLAVALLTVYLAMPEQAPVDVYAKGYKQGMEDALKPGTRTKPNWELEMQCASMWMEKLPAEGSHAK
jgi:hypothetical protein